MDIDRGVLARIDRKLLAGLGQDETFRMVRVPVTAAKWATWQRYCDSAGISMGRAIATLIDHELSKALHETGSDGSPVLAARAEKELARRQVEVARRERNVAATEERLRGWGEHLRQRASAHETREQRAELASKQAPRPEQPRGKVGRNERCPCGSGGKYKHCHGSYSTT